MLNPPSGVLVVSARETGVVSPAYLPFGLLLVRASQGRTLVYDPEPLLFSLFSFLFVFGLLIARASPGSTIVNDPLFVCDFGRSISSRNRCRFARFIFCLGPSFPQHHVYDGNIYHRTVWMYSSLMFVRATFSSVDAYSTRFWADLQTWSARALSMGRTATKAPPCR